MRSILLTCMLLASAAHADITYRATIHKSQGNQHETKTVRVWVHGNSAKVVDEADPPNTSYALVREREQLYLVGIERREYLHVDLKQIIGPKVAEMERARQAHMNAPEAKVLLDEPGPEIAGIATRHYRFRLSVKVELHQPEERFERILIEDFWTAPSIAEQPVGVWQVEQPDVQLDPAINAAFQAVLSQMKGFPLKRSAVMTLKTEEGNTRVGMRSDTEVLELKPTDVPESEVALPAGYKEVRFEDLVGAQKPRSR